MEHKKLKTNKFIYGFFIFFLLYTVLALQAFVLIHVPYEVIKVDIFSSLIFCFIVEKDASTSFFICLLGAFLMSEFSSAPKDFFLILYFSVYCTFFLFQKIFLLRTVLEKVTFLIFATAFQYLFTYFYSFGNKSIPILNFFHIYYQRFVFHSLMLFVIFGALRFFENAFVDNSKFLHYAIK